MVRWCWVNFQCRGVLLIWIIVGQRPTLLAVGADGGSLGIFSLVYHFSLLSPSLWETARYRLKYCLKGPLSPNQPTIHRPSQKPLFVASEISLFCLHIPQNGYQVLKRLSRGKILKVDRVAWKLSWHSVCRVSKRPWFKARSSLNLNFPCYCKVWWLSVGSCIKKWLFHWYMNLCGSLRTQG